MNHKTEKLSLNSHLLVHDNIDDWVPQDRALCHLKRKDSDEDGNGTGEAKDASH